MADASSKNRRNSPVVVDWFYVRYRTLLFAAGALLLLAAVGLWARAALHSGPTEDQAVRAIASASQVVDQAASVAGRTPPPALADARQHLAGARDALANRQFRTACDEAASAEALARDTSGGHAAADSGVRVVRVDGDVRVKRAGQFVWEGASEHDQLRAGDQVRTGANGSAQLVYFDGTMMTISPGTLLEIRELVRDGARRMQRVSERLEFGQLSAQTQDVQGFDSVHEVATVNTSVRARRAAEFRVRQEKDADRAEIVAARGEIVLDTGSREIPVAPSTRLTVAGGRIVEQSRLLDAPQLTSPPDGAATTDGAAVALTWAAVRGASGYRVQLSEKPAFEADPGRDRRTAVPLLEVPALAQGAYYWRVASLDEAGREGPWSESRRFRVATQVLKDVDDRTPPPLEITEIMVVGSNAIVTGRSEPGALVWVDGERVDLEEDGRFTWVVKLREDGRNKIQFLAQDAAGNETRRVGTAWLDGF